MDTFKGELKTAIDKFTEEKMLRGIEQLHHHQQENEDNWRECEPRMEALAQIKSIFRSNFAIHRRKHHNWPIIDHLTPPLTPILSIKSICTLTGLLKVAKE